MKRVFYATAAASTLGALAAPQLSAQEAFQLDEITVLANIGGVDANRTGTSVSVLEGAELHKSGGTAVSDKLNNLAGISVSRNGPIGTQTTLTIRGVNQNNIAVRYEGIDIADPSGTQVSYDFGGLTTGAINKIDVLRGTQSALFGSQAVGGAVLMQGKRATGLGTSVDTQFEVGSYGTTQVSADLSIASNRGELSFGLGRYATQGFSAFEENGRVDAEADGYEETRLNFFASHNLGEATTLELAGFASESKSEFDNNFNGVISDAENVTARTSRGVRLSVIQQVGDVKVTGTVSRFSIDRQLDLSGFLLPYEGLRDNARIEAAFTLGQAIDVVAGVERKVETFQDIEQVRATHVNSSFAQILYAIDGNNDVTMSLRHDEHSAFGGRWSGRLSGAHRVSGNTVLRWSAGTGYRAPSNYELYGFYTVSGSKILVGDPNLQVEKAKSLDLGIEHEFSSAKVAATLFFLEADNLLDYSRTSFTYVQRHGVAQRRGLELSGEFNIRDGLKALGAYSYTATSLNVPLDSSGWGVQVPRHKAALGISWAALQNFDLGLEITASADKPTVRDSAVTNFSAVHRLTDTAEAYLRIENLFDKQYQTISGYGTSDRAFYFGLRASF